MAGLPSTLKRSLALLLLLAELGLSEAYQLYCRCQCEDQYGVFTVGEPEDSRAVCSGCTRKACQEAGLEACKDIAESAITTQCFQRESLKDQFIIYGFCVCTVGLLIYALLAPKIRAALRIGS